MKEGCKVKKLMKDKKGFTLVEILVVLAILAILIAIAVPTMIGALNDAKDKASLADARTAYIAYEIKKSTSDTITNADILEYMDKVGNAKIKCAVVAADNKVTEFYYTDEHLTDRTKYIKITMGNKAEVVSGNFGDLDAKIKLP